METEKIKLKIKKIIYAKETQPYEWRKAIYLLNKLKEEGIDNQYYDLTMAKILLKFNIIAEAKYFLTNMIDNGYEQASTYYHLYKIDILEDNFEDAYLDLFQYKEKYQNKKIEISLPLTMLEIILDLERKPLLYFKTDYQIALTDQLYEYKFLDKTALETYHKAIIALNNRDYTELIVELQKLNDIVDNKNMSVDIEKILLLAVKLKEEVKDVYIQITNGRNDIINKLIDSPNNAEETYLMIKRLDIKQQLIIIDKMIKQDLETATKLLEELSHKSVNYQPQIRYLKNKINEERAYQELGKEQKEVYAKAITKGREQYHDNNLSTAYDYYTYGKYITNHPIFDYYIGKILYKNKNKDEAYKCFKNYIENGGEKYLKALLYLVVIEVTNKKIKSAKKIRYLQKLIVNTFDINFEDIRIDRIINIIMNQGRNDKDFDVHKFAVSHNLILSEEFFDLEYNGISNDRELCKELERIKEMYRNGRITEANKRIEELLKENKGYYQRKNIEGIAKRKKLYINQGNFSKN